MTTIDTVPDIVGQQEIAKRAGVSLHAVRQWRRRQIGFPKPDGWLGTPGMGTPWWRWEPVRDWLHETGRLADDS